MRWLVLVLCSLAALGCATNTEQGDATGSLSLELVLADDIVINSVSWEISSDDMDPMSGTIDTSAPGATASVEVFGLPPGDGYLVELGATSEDGEVTCEGSAEFAVEIDARTMVMVKLNCKLPLGFGDVRVNGKFNICAELLKAIASPLQTSVGNDIDLSAVAEDADGDLVEFAWTESGGTIADPSAASTTYTCEEIGDQTITVTVSDDDFQHCMDDWMFQVTCYESGLCDDVDCDDGNECTDNDCNPANGNCVNEPVDNGTECDGGDGTCFDGMCVEIDRCEDVDCDDGNECTDDVCNPNDGTCSNTPVDDGTECNGGDGICMNGSCMEIDLCEDVDCSSENECVDDGECNPLTGMCIVGDNKPAGTPCGVDGFGVCDGNGNCKINTCAEVRVVVVSPLQTSVGNQISLSAIANDDDDDPIQYLWTATGGPIADPTEASTTYTCEEVGDHDITVSVSDDGFDFCIDDYNVPVTCVPN
jgi:hypothetical protein